MGESSLVTVASFSFPHEAHIAKASLESEGIPAFVADEHTINMQRLYSNALGGVRVQVPFKFLGQAQSILSSDYSDELGPDSELLTCENCGSHKLTPCTKGKKPAFLLFLLLGFPFFFYQHGYKCEKCGAFQKT